MRFGEREHAVIVTIAPAPRNLESADWFTPVLRYQSATVETSVSGLDTAGHADRTLGVRADEKNP